MQTNAKNEPLHGSCHCGNVRVFIRICQFMPSNVIARFAGESGRFGLSMKLVQ
ncbi:hypothetical protein [Pseudomonas syringae]|uniref:Uncharacterized protein n=1 Tax=Pseudomonas syringae pv. solidagae TaxID=264458 RepID=A0A0P9Z1C0_PSESX|nr:hypothetical protein [Pseudomonas syringae]KPY52873.1 Unknown protein sequence [Pseudomonas syringae pv. solidagae]RMT29196.1 hypothetical protein ALP49_00810 [Pseudomonas syringae pv. solidagae]RMT39569.1 hypothetical protein ALP48_02631 [Pseudomonas syringae pv. solidagae]